MIKKIPIFSSLEQLNSTVIKCRRCPRLVYHREHVLPKKAYENEAYWRRPVPGFGDEKAKLLILGLAPGGDGGNRTGRLFTGDPSGRFLMKALYKMGWANQPICESINDGFKLNRCYMTASVKCFPPMHKPNTSEICECSGYLFQEIGFLTHLKSVLILGKIAFDAFILFLKEQNQSTKGLKFKHGQKYECFGLNVYCSYHPSPRNVNTGFLTEEMFLKLLREIET